MRRRGQVPCVSARHCWTGPLQGAVAPTYTLFNWTPRRFSRPSLLTTLLLSAAQHSFYLPVTRQTDSFLPFRILVCPTTNSLVLPGNLSLAKHLSYSHQLLRLPTAPVLVTLPRALGQPDFSYEAIYNAWRSCPGHACDRHLIHAHIYSSKPEANDRHDMVKLHFRA